MPPSDTHTPPPKSQDELKHAINFELENHTWQFPATKIAEMLSPEERWADVIDPSSSKADIKFDDISN